MTIMNQGRNENFSFHVNLSVHLDVVFLTKVRIGHGELQRQDNGMIKFRKVTEGNLSSMSDLFRFSGFFKISQLCCNGRKLLRRTI